MHFSDANNVKHKSILGWIFVISVFLTLSACGGSKVGNQKDNRPPTAHASAIGLSVDKSAGPNTFTARANSDVTLTAKDSSGTDTPIMTFTWSQTEGDTIAFYTRAADTLVFRTPNVNTITRFTFQITVTDANQKSASDTVSISVLPIDDVNQFLTNPAAPSQRLRILAALQGGADTGVNNQPFSITATTIAHWRNSLGELDQIEVSTETIASLFPRNFNPALNYLPTFEARNPKLIFNIAMLRVEDINSNFSSSEQYRRLSASYIDSAYLEIQLVVNGSAGVDFELFALGEDNTIIDGVNILSQEPPLPTLLGKTIKTLLATAYAPIPPTQATNGALLQTWNGEFAASLATDRVLSAIGLENSVTANNYYKLIDPTGRFTRLQSWLDYAGFEGTHDQPAETSDSLHATFFNNFDLGYGRNLWMRSDANGSVYSYVTNFPSVEAVLECRQDFTVFAMEYSDNPDANSNTAKIVKFYAFKPNPLTGEYIRASSVDIDGRGERMLPGACTACHQKYIGGNQFTNTADADLDASFIPLDLDSYLYAKAQNLALIEPTLNASKFSAEELTAHSREEQASSFQKINSTILKTYLDNPSRHNTAIEMIRGWYQDNTQNTQLAENNFDGNYVQPGWIGEEELYKNVFIRNCRTCHAQLDNSSLDFDSYSEFITSANLIGSVYEKGNMPLSKLTLDRFWVDFYGNESGAELLRKHLSDQGKVVPTTLGLPVPKFTISSITPEINTLVALDASLSIFSNSYEWSLTRPINSLAVLNNTTGLTSSFTPDIVDGSYEVRLSVTNSKGQQADVFQTITAVALSPIPSNLIANSISSNQIDLTWLEPTSGADSYAIYRNGDPNALAFLSAPATSYSDAELSSGELYSYTVTGFLSGVESTPSGPAIAATYPDEPSMPTATPISSTEINLGWPAVFCSDSPSYELFPDSLPSVTTTKTDYIFTGLDTQTAYAFFVVATCNGLASNPSLPTPPTFPLGGGG